MSAPGRRVGVLSAPLEALVNRYLRGDPDLAEGLSVLAGRAVVFDVTGTGVSLVVRFGDARVRIDPYPAGGEEGTISGPAPDVVVRATPLALLRLLREADADPTLGGALDIRGDVSVVQRLARALRRLDPDFEEALARVVGDPVAHQAGRGARALAGWASGAAATLAADTGEYLSEEARLVASRGELETFAAEVDALRDTLDRLEQRVQRLQGRARTRGC